MLEISVRMCICLRIALERYQIGTQLFPKIFHLFYCTLIKPLLAHLGWAGRPSHFSLPQEPSATSFTFVLIFCSQRSKYGENSKHRRPGSWQTNPSRVQESFGPREQKDTVDAGRVLRINSGQETQVQAMW